MSRKSSDKLSSRELEIIGMIATGICTKEIAAALGISKNTVGNHRVNILRKTGCRNFAQVVKTIGLAHPIT